VTRVPAKPIPSHSREAGFETTGKHVQRCDGALAGLRPCPSGAWRILSLGKEQAARRTLGQELPPLFKGRPRAPRPGAQVSERAPFPCAHLYPSVHIALREASAAFLRWDVVQLTGRSTCEQTAWHGQCLAEPVPGPGSELTCLADPPLRAVGFLLRGAMHFEQDDSTSYVRLDERKSWQRI
jgi:hypothetical protein